MIRKAISRAAISLFVATALSTSLRLCGGAVVAEAAQLAAVSNPALCDSAVVLSGEGFAAGTEFHLWTPGFHVDAAGKELSRLQWLKLLEEPLQKSLPAVPPRTVRLKALGLNPQVAALEMPPAPAGLGYAAGRFEGKFAGLIYARDGKGWSNPIIINRPDIFFIRPCLPRPGDALRIIGRNFQGHAGSLGLAVLRPRGGGPAVVVSPETGGSVISGDGLDDVQLSLPLPRDMKPGQYELLVCNRTGGRLGWSVPMFLEVMPAAVTLPEEKLKLEEFGAVGDGLNDDSQALLKALDKARGIAAAGSARPVIILPPGRFIVQEPLKMDFPLTVRGAGMDNTFLIRRYKPGQPVHRQAALNAGSGLTMEDLALEGLGLEFNIAADAAGKYSDILLRRLHTDSRIGGGEMRRLQITGCRFSGGAMTWFLNMEDCDFTLNVSRIPQWLSGSGGLELRQAMQRCLVEFNEKVGPRGFIAHKWREPGHLRNLFNGNVVRETLTWDGEGFLVEGAGQVYAAAVAASDKESLTLQGGDFKDDQLKNKVVAVTRGRGLGQYRVVTGNSGSRLTIERPWDLPPGAGAQVTVMGGAVENIFAGETLQHSYGGGPLLYYAGGMGNRIFGHRLFKSAGMYIWSVHRASGDVKHLSEPGASVPVPDYWNVFSGNSIIDNGSFIFHMGEYSPGFASLPGVLQLGNVFRGNTIQNPAGARWGDGAVSFSHSEAYRNRWYRYTLTGDLSETAYWFNIVEDNNIIRAGTGIFVSERSYGAVLRHNRFTEVGNKVEDKGRDTIVVE